MRKPLESAIISADSLANIPNRALLRMFLIGLACGSQLGCPTYGAVRKLLECVHISAGSFVDIPNRALLRIFVMGLFGGSEIGFPSHG